MERKDDEFEEEIREIVEAGESTEPLPEAEETQSWGDRLITAQELSPAYRKMAEMWAQNIPQSEIAKALNYTPSRVSIILSNTMVKAEVERIRERIYEETVGKRLKNMAEPALTVLEKVLRDETHRFKTGEKIDVAKWLLEKVDGKAVQKHALDESTLAAFMDKLDAIKSSGQTIPSFVDVTPSGKTVEGEAQKLLEPSQKSESDALDDWVNSYN